MRPIAYHMMHHYVHIQRIRFPYFGAPSLRLNEWKTAGRRSDVVTFSRGYALRLTVARHLNLADTSRCIFVLRVENHRHCHTAPVVACTVLRT